MTEENSTGHDTGGSSSKGRLAGKVCGITGATGIAEAAALRFAAEGARLFVVALRESDCVALEEQIGSTTEIIWVAADLTDEGETERAFARCAEKYDRLDALLVRRRQRPAIRRWAAALDVAGIVEHDGGAQPQHCVPQLA